jgi:asparagine synthase (glutamine-hydrolysing)
MPGIVGFIDPHEHPARRRELLASMVKAMMHEPHYTSGMLTDDDLGVAVGWIAHGGSFSDCLPLWNEDRTVCLLFSGENYSTPEEVNWLRSRGHVFEGPGASYLVHLYEELGPSFWGALNGTFCGLLIDRRESKVFLFNDRFGLARLYWHERGGACYFGSEAKAIFKAVPDSRQLDARGLGEHLAAGCVLQNRTLYSGISLLPPGAIWTHRPGAGLEKRRYFTEQEWEQQANLPEEEYFQRLKTTFAKVLPRYLTPPESLVMSLTGGLDSRIVMAWAQAESGKLPCYSQRGLFRECADATIARRVASVCGQSHDLVTVAGEFLQQFPSLAPRAVYLTDGTMDASGAAGLYANRRVRTDLASVRLTGNYGGEILRRMVALTPAKLSNRFWSDGMTQYIEDGRRTLLREHACNRTSFIAFKQVPWLHFARFALESSQLPIRSPYLDNDLVALSYQAPQSARTNLHLAERLIHAGNPALTAFPTDRGPLGRPGMFGRLAEAYQEFTFKAEYAYDYGMPRRLVQFDRVLQALRLERLFLGRHKYCHYRTWYRHELAPYVKEILLDTRSLSRPWLDPVAARRMVEEHTSGRGNYTLELHSLLSVEFIHRELIET